MPIGDVAAGLAGRADRVVNLTVREFRLPRVVVGILVGMALGTSGAITQSLTRNPLGSPDALGVVLSGASAGAVAVMLAAGGSTVVAGGASAALSRVGVPLGAVRGSVAVCGTRPRYRLPPFQRVGGHASGRAGRRHL